VERAQASIQAVHEEARSHQNGIGIVKLMGRDSGFIAMYSALASSDVNCLLIPEKPFKLELLVKAIKTRFESGKDHYVIVVAEGAGQELCNSTNQFDASGNTKLVDIGTLLVDQLSRGLKKENIQAQIKYIDPSYTIRSATANSQDKILTVSLAQMAVHAGMAGKTNIVVGLINGEYCHIPISAAVAKRKVVDIDGELYRTFLDNSGMPDLS
jgi:6-phosphofructokinase 1